MTRCFRAPYLTDITQNHSPPTVSRLNLFNESCVLPHAKISDVEIQRLAFTTISRLPTFSIHPVVAIDRSCVFFLAGSATIVLLTLH